MSYVMNLTIGDDGAPKVVMTCSGVWNRERPASRLIEAVLDAVTTVTEELEQEGVDVQYIMFDRSTPKPKRPKTAKPQA